jgi:hypothetical protein
VGLQVDLRFCASPNQGVRWQLRGREETITRLSMRNAVESMPSSFAASVCLVFSAEFTSPLYRILCIFRHLNGFGSTAKQQFPTAAPALQVAPTRAAPRLALANNLDGSVVCKEDLGCIYGSSAADLTPWNPSKVSWIHSKYETVEKTCLVFASTDPQPRPNLPTPVLSTQTSAALFVHWPKGPSRSTCCNESRFRHPAPTWFPSSFRDRQ